MCLVTLASGARLSESKEADPEEQPPTLPEVVLSEDQQRDLHSSHGPETKHDFHSSHGPEMKQVAAAMKGVDDHLKETSGGITFTSAEGDTEGVVLGDSSDDIGDDDDHEKDHDSLKGYGDGGDDGQEEEYSYLNHTGYGSNDDDREYLYYYHPGFGDKGDDHELDNNSETSEELLYWYGSEFLRNQGANCSDIGGGFHLCFQDDDEDMDESDSECDHNSEGDNKDCDHSWTRLTEYFGDDEDEEWMSGEHDIHTLDEGYLISVKDLDDDENDNDEDVDDVMDNGGDDGDDNDVYLFLNGSDTTLLSFLNLIPNTNESDSAFRALENDNKNVSGESEPAKRSLYGSKSEQPISEHVYHKTDQSPPTDYGENVLKDEIVVLSNTQNKSLAEMACSQTGRCLGGTTDDREAIEGDGSNASGVNTFPVPWSTNITQQDLYFADISRTIRGNQINDKYFSQNELNNISKKFESFNLKENEEWNHETTAYEEIYDLLMHSGQVSDEEKNYIASLEQLRRVVNRLGGLKTLLEKPEIHHIVKRQTRGNEACVFLRRRRRRSAGETGESERASRARRGVSNIGRNLEQGNPRFRQLFGQYKTMCDFLSMSVFQK